MHLYKTLAGKIKSCMYCAVSTTTKADFSAHLRIQNVYDLDYAIYYEL